MPVHTHSDGVAAWFGLSSADPGAAADFYGRLFGWDHTDFPTGGSARSANRSRR